MKVAILGASNKPERYSYKAIKLLAEKGHTVFPVNPAVTTILGQPVYKKIEDISEVIDTVTIYMNAERSSALAGELLAARPRRVIFNPGAENQALSDQLEAAGIETVEACTLVMLNLGHF